MSGRDRHRMLDPLLAALLGLGALALYILTLAPTVLTGDGGEFQFVPYLLGVAHPTGYPLFTLLGSAWSHLLPLGDVAFRMNLFSAFWAALAVVFTYGTARAFMRQAVPTLPPTAGRIIAALVAAILAVTPTLWSQAIIAEVYGLQTFLVVIILYLILAWAENRREWVLVLAAACFGLGLAHHSTTVLLVPAVLVYLWLVDRSILENWRLLTKVLAAILLPLALYLLIPIRAPSTPYLQLPLTAGRELVLYENTLANLLSFVTGGPYGGYLDLSVDLGARLNMTWHFLIAEFGWIGLLLALAGLVRLVIGRQWALLALTGLVYAATVLFNLFYTIGDIFVLYIPSYLAVGLWITMGLVALSETVQRLFGTRRWAGTVVLLPFVALPLCMLVGDYSSLDQRQNTAAQTRWQSILAEPLPSDAVLISNDRNDIMPMWYYQYVDRQRPGWLGLFPLITSEYPGLGDVFDLALSTGRPVYIIKEMPGVEIRVDVAPEGQLWRVTGSTAQDQPDFPRHDLLAGVVALTGYDRSPRSPQPTESLKISLYWNALQPLGSQYHTYVHLVDDTGQRLVQSDHQPGGSYYATDAWRPGEVLRDDHFLTIPPATPAGVYQLRSGMYAFAGDGTLEPIGEPVTLGSVAVKGDVQDEPDPPAYSVGVRFGDEIELLGYDVAPTDGQLAVTFHWQAVHPLTTDYTVFVHLVDAGGDILVQDDSQPRGGSYPTSVWDAGEVVVDEHLLTLPVALTSQDISADDYELRVGLYSLEGGQRLLLSDGSDGLRLGMPELSP